MKSIKKIALYLFSLVKHKKWFSKESVPYIVIASQYPDAVILGTKKQIEYIRSMGSICKLLGLKSEDFK